MTVSRLNLVMFNAILHESSEKVPTNLISDPINDSKIILIPAGKSSFWDSAQLKSTVSYETLCLFLFLWYFFNS